MPEPLLRTGRCMLIAALFVASGGHWAVLQTIAWGSMIVEYSHSETVTAAVEKTFDGKHPCALCKEVRRGRHSEKKPASLVTMQKVHLLPLATPEFSIPFMKSWVLELADLSAEQRVNLPALLPPRLG